MKRKLFILVLAVISCIACVFGVTACNTEKPDDSGNGQGTIQTPPETDEGLIYLPYRTGYAVTGYDGEATTVVVPAEYSGKKVISIGIGSDTGFAYASHVTEIVLPDTIQQINSGAFSYCTGLQKITIPTCITFGDKVFFNCTALTEITMPSSNTYGNALFEGCTSLKTLSYTGGIAGWCKLRIPAYLIPDGVELYIDGKVLSGELIIPDGVTSINNASFQNFSKLTSVKIPDSVTSISDRAFDSCTGLTSITIGNGVTNIGESAFNNCTALTSITIGNGVTNIGEWAFNNCTALTSITIPDSVTSISGGAFNGCSGLKSITIPESVTSIGSDIFRHCDSLETVYYSGDIASLCNIGCYWLYVSQATAGTPIDPKFYIDGKELSGEIIIPEGVTSIGKNAFFCCTKITSVTIPKSVTSIGAGAFYCCRELTSITIPESVTNIGNSAIYNTSIRTIYFEGTIEQWNNITKDKIYGYRGYAAEVVCKDGTTYYEEDY